MIPFMSESQEWTVLTMLAGVGIGISIVLLWPDQFGLMYYCSPFCF